MTRIYSQLSQAEAMVNWPYGGAIGNMFALPGAALLTNNLDTLPLPEAYSLIGGGGFDMSALNLIWRQQDLLGQQQIGAMRFGNMQQFIDGMTWMTVLRDLGTSSGNDNRPQAGVAPASDVAPRRVRNRSVDDAAADDDADDVAPTRSRRPSHAPDGPAPSSDPVSQKPDGVAPSGEPPSNTVAPDSVAPAPDAQPIQAKPDNVERPEAPRVRKDRRGGIVDDRRGHRALANAPVVVSKPQLAPAPTQRRPAGHQPDVANAPAQKPDVTQPTVVARPAPTAPGKPGTIDPTVLADGVAFGKTLLAGAEEFGEFAVDWRFSPAQKKFIDAALIVAEKELSGRGLQKGTSEYEVAMADWLFNFMKRPRPDQWTEFGQIHHNKGLGIDFEGNQNDASAQEEGSIAAIIDQPANKFGKVGECSEQTAIFLALCLHAGLEHVAAVEVTRTQARNSADHSLSHVCAAVVLPGAAPRLYDPGMKEINPAHTQTRLMSVKEFAIAQASNYVANLISEETPATLQRAKAMIDDAETLQPDSLAMAVAKVNYNLGRSRVLHRVINARGTSTQTRAALNRRRVQLLTQAIAWGRAALVRAEREVAPNVAPVSLITDLASTKQLSVKNPYENLVVTTIDILQHLGTWHAKGAQWAQGVRELGDALQLAMRQAPSAVALKTWYEAFAKVVAAHRKEIADIPALAKLAAEIDQQYQAWIKTAQK